MTSRASSAISDLQKAKLGALIRVETKVAKELLLNDTTITKESKPYWLRMRNLGLGVYEVWAETTVGTAKKNLLVK